MINAERFRKDFLARMDSTGMKQTRICELYAVQQGSLSRFIKGKTGLSFEYVLKLWPFVYQAEFPETKLEASSHVSDV